jgi:hypothetical protein
LGHCALLSAATCLFFCPHRTERSFSIKQPDTAGAACSFSTADTHQRQGGYGGYGGGGGGYGGGGYGGGGREYPNALRNGSGTSLLHVCAAGQKQHTVFTLSDHITATACCRKALCVTVFLDMLKLTALPSLLLLVMLSMLLCGACRWWWWLWWRCPLCLGLNSLFALSDRLSATNLGQQALVIQVLTASSGPLLLVLARAARCDVLCSGSGERRCGAWAI